MGYFRTKKKSRYNRDQVLIEVANHENEIIGICCGYGPTDRAALKDALFRWGQWRELLARIEGENTKPCISCNNDTTENRDGVFLCWDCYQKTQAE